MSSSTIVTLAYDQGAFPEPPVGHGWLEAGPAPVSGVTLSSNKWAGRAPEGMVLLRAFVPARLGPLGHQPDEVLVPAVAEHVRAVMGVRGAPVLTRVTRWTDVMPTYTVGHPARAAQVDAALGGRRGWAVAGSALHGVGVPECIADGQRAAREALGVLG
jgi:oxygen-dependent protoporphyrinogen oxidase